VVGFKKIKFYTMENVGAGTLSMPEQEMQTNHSGSFPGGVPGEDSLISRRGNCSPASQGSVTRYAQ